MNLKNKNKIKVGLLAAALLVVLLHPAASRADSLLTVPTNPADVAKQEIAVKQQQLAALNQQISTIQTQIQAKHAEGATLGNEVALYDLQIQATNLQEQATQTNVDNTNLQIKDTQDQIAAKQVQVAQEKAVLADLMVSVNEYDNTSDLQLSLGTGSFSAFMDQVQYTESLQSKVYALLQQVKDLEAKLQADQLSLRESLAQLSNLQTSLQLTVQSLTDQKQQKVALLATTHGQEKKYQSLLASTQNQEAQIQEEMNNLDNQVQGKPGFTKLLPIHGIIQWPLDGVITQGYGNTGFTKLGYNFHNGLDIAGPPGTPIAAAADGTVIATGTGQAAYGNWVAIKHTITTAGGHQIITLYGHMVKFIVTVGESVHGGDLIGYEGNTGNTTRLLYGPEHGYHLHFTVFDAVGFGVQDGAYPQTYGPYQIPYGYTYNPLDFL